jgi:thioesterase domain-containing protein
VAHNHLILLSNKIYRDANKAEEPDPTMTTDDETVEVLKTSDTGAILFCFPGPNHFRDMAKIATTAGSIIGVDVIKLYEAHPTYTMAQIAGLCIETIRKYQVRGPYYFCGWSFGGFVAYEMAVQLVNAGDEVGLLVVLDVGNPAPASGLTVSNSLRFRLTYLGDRLKKYARNLLDGNFRNFLDDALRFVTPKPDKASWFLVEPVFRMLKQPIPKKFQINNSIVDVACREFRPRFYAGRLVLICAQSRGSEFNLEPTLGWNRCVSGPIDIHLVSGDHLSMMEPPNVSQLAEKLVSYLPDENLLSGTGNKIRQMASNPLET